MSARRAVDFRIVAMYGHAADDRLGIEEEEQLSSRVRYYKVRANKDFVNNQMRGSFYQDLAQRVLGDHVDHFVTKAGASELK